MMLYFLYGDMCIIGKHRARMKQQVGSEEIRPFGQGID